MCGQCAFLKEKYCKEGNGGGKKYYCEYLKEYVYGNDQGCNNFKKDTKRPKDKITALSMTVPIMIMVFPYFYTFFCYYSLLS